MSRRYYARPVRTDRPGGPWEVADRMTGRRVGESYGCESAARKAVGVAELSARAGLVAGHVAAFLAGELSTHRRT